METGYNIQSDHEHPPSPERTIAQMAELAGGLAHELRNPLSTMMINLKLLAEDLQDGDAHPDDVRRRALLKVDTLRREAERLQNLFDDFLNLAGPQSLERTDTDMRPLVQRMVAFVEPLATANRVRVTAVTPNAPVLCYGDTKLVSQALLNVVINAQQAMPDGGDLRISVGEEKDQVVLTVTDTGVGIAQEDQGRIFKPFFSTKGRGTGLGLSITQRIIQEHGGTLSFESNPGRGTTFTIRLPRRANETDNDGPEG